MRKILPLLSFGAFAGLCQILMLREGIFSGREDSAGIEPTKTPKTLYAYPTFTSRVKGAM